MLKRTNIGLLIILLISLFIRLKGIMFGFPYVYYTDESILVNHAMAFGTGDLNPHYFIWPHLMMYVLFIIYGIEFLLGYLLNIFTSTTDFVALFFSNATWFYLPGRLISAFSGVYTSYYLYRLGAKYFNKTTGYIAAFIIVVSTTHSMFSHYVKTHVPAALLVIIGIGLCLEIINGKDRIIDYIKAGFVFGIGTAVIYHVGFSVLCLFTVALIQASERSKGLKNFLLNFPYLKLFAGGFTSIFAFFLCSPYIILDYRSFISEFLTSGLLRNSGTYWVEGPLFSFTSTINGIGFPLGLLLIPALVYPFFKRGNKYIWVIWTQPVLLMLIQMLFSSKQYHHTLIIYPAVALLIAYFSVDISRRLLKRYFNPDFVVIILLIALSIIPLIKSYSISTDLSKTDTRTVAREWVMENIPHHSKIIMDSGKYYLTTYGPELPMTKVAFERIINREAGIIGEDQYKRVGTRKTGYEGAVKFFKMKMEAQSEGPEYDIYQIIHDLVIENIDVKSYAEYVQKGIEYAIVNQHMIDNYKPDTEVSVNYPVGAKIYRQFYQDLKNNGDLLQVFKPSDKLTGPVLNIYKLNELELTN